MFLLEHVLWRSESGFTPQESHGMHSVFVLIPSVDLPDCVIELVHFKPVTHLHP